VDAWGTLNQTYNSMIAGLGHRDALLRVFWGGAHATLFQRSTATRVIQHMFACGAGAPDIEGYRNFATISPEEYIAQSSIGCGSCTESDIAFPLLCPDVAKPEFTKKRVARCLSPIGAYDVDVPKLAYLSAQNISGDIYEPLWNTSIVEPPPVNSGQLVWPAVPGIPYVGP